METGMRQEVLYSYRLDREVRVDLYDFCNDHGAGLLLINDGQMLEKMQFPEMLDCLSGDRGLRLPFICAMHAGPERRQEYGVAGIPDFAGRGARAGDYTDFVLEELMPWLRRSGAPVDHAPGAFAGFSLGALSAMDIVWNYPDRFQKAGVFSGSLWWRTRDLGEGYLESRDRIIHQRIREGSYVAGLRFFLECGTADETMDRNGNGTIDSVQDTLDLVRELEHKGYRQPEELQFRVVEGGTHQESTWKEILPEFFRWGWSSSPGLETSRAG